MVVGWSFFAGGSGVVLLCIRLVLNIRLMFVGRDMLVVCSMDCC